MQRAWVGVILCVIAMIGLPQNPASAQVPETQAPVGWDIGIVYADGASEDDPIMLEEDDRSIKFWIRNDFLVDIEVVLDYDGQLGQPNGEELVIVSSGSNDTFTLEFDYDPWNVEGGFVGYFRIRGSMTALGPVQIPAYNPYEEVEGEVMNPNLHRWDVHINDIEHTISAGTEFNLKIHFLNMGNTPDAIASITVEDDCPVLSVDESPLQDATNQVVVPYMRTWTNEYNGEDFRVSTTLVFDASSTHPTRLCEIEVTARSSGVANGGLGDSSNKGETVVSVEARPVGAQVDQDEADVGDNDGPQNQDQVTRDNFLGFPSLLTPLVIASAAWFQSRRN